MYRYEPLYSLLVILSRRAMEVNPSLGTQSEIPHLSAPEKADVSFSLAELRG